MGQILATRLALVLNDVGIGPTKNARPFEAEAPVDIRNEGRT
jgi:hypothetical protein